MLERHKANRIPFILKFPYFGDSLFTVKIGRNLLQSGNHLTFSRKIRVLFLTLRTRLLLAPIEYHIAGSAETLPKRIFQLMRHHACMLPFFLNLKHLGYCLLRIFRVSKSLNLYNESLLALHGLVVAFA